nr:ribonuclease H-like domain-containing protein [Tanacetum cinerariifolium]
MSYEEIRPLFEEEYNKVQTFFKEGPEMNAERIKAPRKRTRKENVEKDQTAKKQKDPLPIPLSEKLSLVTHHHLLTRVPIKLDLTIWNYSSWQYFFKQLYESYEALKFIHGPQNTSSSSTQAPPIPFTLDEMKVDKIILSWIFTTISDLLQKRLVIARPTSAKVAWDFIASLASPVSEDDVVHNVINGLPARYNQVCRYMHYQETFLGFKTVRSLLLTEEMRLKTIQEDSSPSSPIMLLAESGTSRRPSNPQVKSLRPCFNFAKGSCRYGSDCRYLHDATSKPAASSSRHSSNITEALLIKLLDKLGVNDIGQTRVSNNNTLTTTPIAYTATANPVPVHYLAQSHNPHLAQQVITPPTQYVAQTTLPQLGQYPAHGSSATPRLMDNTSQATLLPQAFTIGTLHDPATENWNMDTGASSHLNNSVTSLNTIFNSCMYPSVSDFLMRRVLLHCDSTGDLYPVTPPSPIPHAFLVSQHTWHQRLGHPGSKVLRRLVSSKSISCNKEKPLVLYHACQLGKHVGSHFQFNYEIKSFQCDHDGEFDNRALHKLFAENGIQFRFSCAHTSQQNGKSERRIRTLNNLIRTLLFQQIYQQPFWVEALNMAIYLLNILPSTAIASEEFSMTDLGLLIYFLGISVTRDSFEIFLSQKKYALEILERDGMVHCNSSQTPIDTESKLGDTDLVAYSDADWAGCPTTRRSTSGYYIFLGNNLLSWSFKRQPTISRSSAEAKYRGVANAIAETCWLRNILHELHSPLSSATLVYCDNVSAFYLSCNPVQHQRNKHIEIDIHFVRDLVTTG